jgi:hypothetical protein
MGFSIAAEIIHIRVRMVEVIHIIGKIPGRVGEDDKNRVRGHDLAQCGAPAGMEGSRQVIFWKIVADSFGRLGKNELAEENKS